GHDVEVELLFNGLTNHRTIPEHMVEPLRTFIEVFIFIYLRCNLILIGNFLFQKWLLADDMLLVGSFVEVLGISEYDKASKALVTIFEYIGETPALLNEAMSREVAKTSKGHCLLLN